MTTNRTAMMPVGSPSPNPLVGDLDHILEHTQGLWDELRGERIFITGGTGFFGCWLLESLAWANHRLNLGVQAVVLTRSPQRFQCKAPHLAADPAIQLLQGDVRDFAFPTGRFPFVIHAATEANAKLNTDQPLLMMDTILQGTRRALDFAAACGTQKFLLTSSGAVYGKQPPGMDRTPEDYSGAPDPMDPAAAYGLGKRTAEHLCALYARQYGLQAKIARCFAFVGPYLPLNIHFAVGNFIQNALAGEPIVIKGDGTPYRSYLYAADLAIWLWTILLRGESCRAYNVGSGEAISILELARLVVQVVDPRLNVNVLGVAVPGKLPERYVPDVTRAENELGLRVWISPQIAIQRTAMDYRGNRAASFFVENGENVSTS